MKDNPRYAKALERAINETWFAILEQRAQAGIENAEIALGVDFFRVSLYALFNDMIAHAIKLFDRSSKSASFWYLYKCQGGLIDNFIKKNNIDFDNLSSVSEGLNHIRDKTHFHIDKKRVFDPNEVWKEAGIKGSELNKVLNDLWEILQHLHEVLYGEKYLMPEYDGKDATEILVLADKHGLIN